MNQTYSTYAVALKRSVFRENDVRTVFYSRERGRLELIGRGVKKISSKLAGHLEPLTLARIMVVKGKHYDYVGAAKAEDCFSGLKNDWEKISAAGAIAGTMEKFSREGEKEERFFDLFLDALRALEKTSRVPSPRLWAVFLKIKLLALSGWKADWEKCHLCGSGDFSQKTGKIVLSKGGVICRNCLKKENVHLTISSACANVIRSADKMEFNFLAKIRLNNKDEEEAEKAAEFLLSFVF